MPNLAALREQGRYSRLRTTFPPLSPVAWATFATGSNPGKAQSVRLPEPQPPLLPARAFLVARTSALKGVESGALADSPLQADGGDAEEEPAVLVPAWRQPRRLDDPAGSDHIPSRAVRGAAAFGHVHPRPPWHPGQFPSVHERARGNGIRGSRSLLSAGRRRPGLDGQNPGTCELDPRRFREPGDTVPDAAGPGVGKRRP